MLVLTERPCSWWRLLLERAMLALGNAPVERYARQIDITYGSEAKKTVVCASRLRACSATVYDGILTWLTSGQQAFACCGFAHISALACLQSSLVASRASRRHR
jgi:hypothetical protein